MSVNDIKGFWNEYRFLSNFAPINITLDGEVYPTVEHAYQAAKTLDTEERKLIMRATKPQYAKRLGYTITLRKDWEDIKFTVMKDLVRQKFQNSKTYRQRLLDTGDAYIEETNNWGDKVWGVCDGKGENRLGKILMEVRTELRQ